MSGYTRDQAFAACIDLQDALWKLREPLLEVADPDAREDARVMAKMFERYAVQAGRIAAYIDPALDEKRHPHSGTA